MNVPKDVIDRLSRLSIEKVAERLGLEVNKHKALCFMHEDHDPSITFSVTKNIYRCWVCGVGGGPIKLVQDFKKYGFQDSCIWLGREFNIWRPKEVRHIKGRIGKESAPVSKPAKDDLSPKQIDREIGEWIVDHSVLSRLSRQFLFEERKYKREVVDDLRIGSLTYPGKLSDSLISVFGWDRCERSGFFKKWKDRLHLCYKAPCLLFPYYDEDGALYCIQSRFLGEVIDKKDRFKFPKGIKQRLYNRPILKELKNNEPLYICEGVTDCIALLSSGKKAVAFPSSSICHPEDIRLLSGKYLFMYPDKDVAGDGLYRHLSEGLQPFSNVVHRLYLPEGFKDYSDYYLSLQ